MLPKKKEKKRNYDVSDVCDTNTHTLWGIYEEIKLKN